MGSDGPSKQDIDSLLEFYDVNYEINVRSWIDFSQPLNDQDDDKWFGKLVDSFDN